MFANVKTNKIEMSKREANAIGRTSSDEFKEFVSLKSVFPTFEIKVVSRKANPLHKGLKYEVMEDYIKNSDNENKEELLENFKTLTKNDGGYKNANAFEVREWFLDTFPEIEQAEKERRAKVEKILNEAKENKIEYLRKVA